MTFRRKLNAGREFRSYDPFVDIQKIVQNDCFRHIKMSQSFSSLLTSLHSYWNLSQLSVTDNLNYLTFYNGEVNG
jgi:hypothetical protein